MLQQWNRTTTCRTLFAAGAIVAFAQTTHAQEEPGQRNHPRPNQFMKDADLNGDRQLSFEEASTAMPHITAERFERMDQNSDGQLTPNEIHRGRPRDGNRRPGQGGDPARRFARLDANGDGQVSYEEITAVRPNMPPERFERIDEDGSGFLSREELDRAHRRRMEGRRGGGGGRRGGNPARHFERADANGDGMVSYDELSAVAPRMNERIFSRIDANGDGSVSLEEMKQHRPPPHGPGPGGEGGRRHGPPPGERDFGQEGRP